MRTNPVVLVNGNPESVAVWDLLADRLNRTDIVRRSPPGFGAPLSEQFPSTVIGYRDWLVAELEQLDGPVDLVGHDVGGSTVLGVAMTRPDLIRTWVSDPWACSIRTTPGTTWLGPGRRREPARPLSRSYSGAESSSGWPG